MVTVRGDTIGVEDGQMPLSDNGGSSGAIDRKLRALTAMFLDPAATEAEKANAETLKARLEPAFAGGCTRGEMDGQHVSAGPGR